MNQELMSAVLWINRQASVLFLELAFQNGAVTEDITHAMEKVSKIFEIEILEKDYEQVSTEDLFVINQKIKDCESEIKKLSELLSSKGYS